MTREIFSRSKGCKKKINKLNKKKKKTEKRRENSQDLTQLLHYRRLTWIFRIGFPPRGLFHGYLPSRIIVLSLVLVAMTSAKRVRTVVRDFPTCLSRSRRCLHLPEATLYLSRSLYVYAPIHAGTLGRIPRQIYTMVDWIEVGCISRLDAAPRMKRRREMHLSGRETPPSGFYLAERKKPKNLYHLAEGK